MMSIKKILFIVIMAISFTGCCDKNSDIPQIENPESVILPYSDGIKLTLDDVINLSGKGYDLKWSDFDGYSYYETGYGLCICVYEINEKFSLRIGGTVTYNNVRVAGYFYLESDNGNFIDIRSGNVKDFINEHS